MLRNSLDPDSDFWLDPDSMNMDPKHCLKDEVWPEMVTYPVLKSMSRIRVDLTRTRIQTYNFAKSDPDSPNKLRSTYIFFQQLYKTRSNRKQITSIIL